MLSQFGVEAAQNTVESASGWIGLLVVLLYSLLVATVLPLPIQAVLVAPVDPGLPAILRYSVVVLVSAIGTTTGSIFAFHFGQRVKRRVRRFAITSRWRVPTVLEPIAARFRRWFDSETEGVLDERARSLIERWGYVGLFIALSIPFFPHKTSVYAVSMLDDDYLRFGLAVFGGATGRLLISLGVAVGILAGIQ
jgi:membrane protein YqaA with SNARE-associated domain